MEGGKITLFLPAMDRKKLVAVFMIVFTVMASSFAFYFYQIIYTPNLLIDHGGDQEFAIPKNSTFREVRNTLYNLGYLNDAVSFSFLAKIKGYDTQVKPGMYLLKENMTNNEAINLLRSGSQTPVKVTFSVARKVEELPEKIAPFVGFSAEEISQLLLHDSTATYYGFEAEELIAMFIPNTYEVYWTITPKAFLDRMKTEYKKFWSDERLKKAEALSLSPLEVATLASIVESETKKMDEAPRVAGVYLNRLKRGIPLQADPTLVFALGDFSIRRVLDEDKKIDSPYNTYKYEGLPPGPISMPSIAALESVLNYEEHKFLYFCARADFSGYHAFATNLIDHNKNAKAFQQALNKEKIFR